MIPFQAMGASLSQPSPATPHTELEIEDVLNMDELGASDDELPETISGTQVKKEKLSTPALKPLRFKDGHGKRMTSPIVLISDDEGIGPSKPASEDSSGQGVVARDSDIEDMYADPPDEAPLQKDVEMSDDTQREEVPEEKDEDKAGIHPEIEEEEEEEEEEVEPEPERGSREPMGESASVPNIPHDDAVAKTRPESSEPASDKEASPAEQPVPPPFISASQPLPSTAIPNSSPRKSIFAPKPLSLEKRKSLLGISSPSLSQPPPGSGNPRPFKKPASKPRVSLPNSSRTFAEPISGPPAPKKRTPVALTPSQSSRKRKDPEDEGQRDNANKRPRTSTPHSPSDVVKQSPSTDVKGRKHEQYWLLDGSVVIHIQGVRFKLHRSTLVNKSKYFKRLMARLSLAEDIPQYDIPGVSVIDFVRLLQTIDSGVAYVFDPPPFRVIASVLRVSRKLEFEKEYEFAARSIRSIWPAALSQLSPTPIDNAAATIIVAKECDMPEVLKRAYYELLRSRVLGQDPVENTDETDEDVKNRTLGQDEIITLIETRERLDRQWYYAADRPPKQVDFPCPLSLPADNEDEKTLLKKDACARAREDILKHWDNEVKASDLFEDCMYDPLCGLERLSQINWEALGFCDGCVKSWREYWAATREKLWENLDIWLKLPKENSVSV